MLLLLSGTGEGRILGARLRAEGLDFLASVTTPEARQLFADIEPPPEVLVTRFSHDALGSLVRQRQIRAILDATHPFAQRISQEAMQVAVRERVPYVRYERPTSTPAPTSLGGTGAEIISVPDMAAAADLCLQRGTRIFLTTGTKTLPLFREVLTGKWVLARILPTIASLAQALEAGLAPAQILALRGPFSAELERALLRHYRIDLLVTKDSGGAGGVDVKLAAAADLRVPTVVVGRPPLTYPNLCHDLEQAVQTVITLMQEGMEHG